MNAEYHRAFSLIELLTVIAIMAILIALVAPAVSGIGGANNLTVATQSLIDQLNKARQEAISRNRVVQVQFLKTSRNADSNAFRAVRSIVLNEAAQLGNGAVTNRVVWLPQGIIVSEDTVRSALAQLGTSSNVTLPGNISADANLLMFRPNGMLDLPGASIHWTLVQERGGTNNFSTVQMDTRTGRSQLFRP